VKLIISEESKHVELITDAFESSEINSEGEETVDMEDNNENPSTTSKPSEEVEENVNSEIQKMEEEDSTSISEEIQPTTSQDKSELNESNPKNDKKQGSFFDQLD
jgi:cell division initiation protein